MTEKMEAENSYETLVSNFKPAKFAAYYNPED
jgi:hypothetical protein